MRVLYIDIYFLINFTTDMLALYFASRLCKVRGTAFRLILASAIGAIFACVIVLFEIHMLIYFLAVISSAWVITWVFAGKRGILRAIKHNVSFIITETLLGGAVTLLFRLLNSVIPAYSDSEGGAENRTLLIVTASILLSYGVIRLAFCMLRGSVHEENVNISIWIGDKSITLSALVDSGNMLCDPYTGGAVVIVKAKSISAIIPEQIQILKYNGDMKRRIRLIPAKGAFGGEMLTGIRTDRITVGKTDHAGAVIALDTSGGSFSGHDALLPISLI